MSSKAKCSSGGTRARPGSGNAAERLGPRRLSCSVQPLRAATDVKPDDRQRAMLVFLAQHTALPLDLLARLLSCSLEDAEALVEEGVGYGWLKVTEYAGEKYAWVLLRRGGMRRVGMGLERPERPRSGGLDHRRRIVEVRLLLGDEQKGWRWLGERELRSEGVSAECLPDGVLVWGDARWAVKVVAVSKAQQDLRREVARHCEQYERAIYFCRAPTYERLKKLQEESGLSNLEIRLLPGEVLRPRVGVPSAGEYKPTPRETKALRLIVEEGMVSVAQFPRLARWPQGAAEEVLRSLERNSLAQRGLEQDEDGGWIWCNYRGTERSGTGLTKFHVPASGGVRKRVALMEVRLDVEARHPDAKWATRRLLTKQQAFPPRNMPTAAVEISERRYAVILLEGRIQPCILLDRLRLWAEEYDGILCYRSTKLSYWLSALIDKHGIEGIEVRDIPRPPNVGPFKALDDEWRTRRDPYQPTERELHLLKLTVIEGMVSLEQAPRLLGKESKEVKELVLGLEQRLCLKRGFLDHLPGGWFWCSGRGTRMSETGLAPFKVPKVTSADHRMLLMEIRLNETGGDPASWRTRRELAKGLKTPEVVPHAALRRGSEWCGVAVFTGVWQREKTLKVLRQWRPDFDRLLCYCPGDEVEKFNRFLARHRLHVAEALPIPSGSPAVHKRQKKLVDEKRRHAEREHYKVLAWRAVSLAVQTGRLEKPRRCVHGHRVKSRRELQAHHEDYRRPLDVIWLCPACHAKYRSG